MIKEFRSMCQSVKRGDKQRVITCCKVSMWFMNFETCARMSLGSGYAKTICFTMCSARDFQKKTYWKYVFFSSDRFFFLQSVWKKNTLVTCVFKKRFLGVPGAKKSNQNLDKKTRTSWSWYYFRWRTISHSFCSRLSPKYSWHQLG